jgi:CheY-like chemotaxis protein
MDVQMPEMDGCTAAAEIRRFECATGGHVPIIAMTAHAMKGDREKCLAAGMDGFVSKPIRFAELFREISRVVTSARGTATQSRAGTKSAGDQESAASDVASPCHFSASGSRQTGADSCANVLDKAAALKRVESNCALLSDLIGMYFDDCPKLMREMEAALAAVELKALEKAAHTLKSLVGIFHANAAFQAAMQLEKLAREGRANEVADAHSQLCQEVARVGPALEQLRNECAAGVRIKST